MLSVDVQDQDARRVMQALDLDMGSIMKRVGERAADLTRQRFRTQTEPSGRRWAPHSLVTRRLRKRRGSFGVGILFDLGRLFGSVRSDATPTEARVQVGGVPDVWAKVHQDGNPTNRMFGGPLAPIPARPFIPTSPRLPESYVDPLLEPAEAAIYRALYGGGYARRA